MESMRNVKRWIGVGGTVTSLASMLQELEVYDSLKVQDYVISSGRCVKDSREII